MDSSYNWLVAGAPEVTPSKIKGINSFHLWQRNRTWGHYCVCMKRFFMRHRSPLHHFYLNIANNICLQKKTLIYSRCQRKWRTSRPPFSSTSDVNESCIDDVPGMTQMMGIIWLVNCICCADSHRFDTVILG